MGSSGIMKEQPWIQVLMVEDETRFADLAKDVLSTEGYRVECVASVAEARVQILERGDFDLVLSDYALPDGNGLDVLKLVHESLFGVPFVMLTAFGNIELAVEALRAGATDFLTKPIDKNRLVTSLKRALSRKNLSRESDWAGGDQDLSSGLERKNAKPSLSILIGNSEKIKKTREQYEEALRRVESPILLIGEDGTERDQLALNLAGSDGVQRGVIRYDLSVIHRDLLDEEFFGVPEGLGLQLSAKPPVLELARGSVLMLEGFEVTNENFQKKLIASIGAKEGAFLDTRIVVVTDESFFAKASQSEVLRKFLEHCNPVIVRVPSFRERSKEDQRQVLNLIWSRVTNLAGRTDLRMEEDLVEELCRNSWPRNFSEIEDVMHVLAVRASGNFAQVSDLPLAYRKKAPEHGQFNLREHVRLAKERAEKHWVDRALEETRGNITQAAKLLGISRRGLQILMKTHT